MSKPKKQVKLKVVVRHVTAIDAEGRLARALNLLLYPVQQIHLTTSKTGKNKLQ